MKRLKRTVRAILNEKGDDIYSVHPESTITEAVDVMKRRNIGAVVVLNDDDGIAGILSERDCTRDVIPENRNPDDIAVKEMMEADVVSVTVGDSVETCMEIMTEGRLRHLPVYDGDDLAGVISVGDVVKSVIDKQERTIEHLENYIRSDRR